SPVDLRDIQPAQLLISQGQVMPRQVTLDADVDAGKVPSRRRLQDLLPARNGAGPVLKTPQGNALLEEDFDVGRVKPASLLTSQHRLTLLSQSIVTLGDQGIELAHDGIARVRAFQALSKQRQRLAEASLFLVDGAEIEGDESILG